MDDDTKANILSSSATSHSQTMESDKRDIPLITNENVKSASILATSSTEIFKNSKVDEIRKLAMDLVEPWCEVIDCLCFDKVWKEEYLDAFHEDLKMKITIQKIIITNAQKMKKNV